MTAPTIRSRRSEVAARRARIISKFIAVSLWRAMAVIALAIGLLPDARAAAPVRLPIMQNVGVIPVQWEGEASGVNHEPVAAAFANAVRSSHRFRVLDDELVAGMWEDRGGRDELRGQFELHAYFGLTVTPRSDTVDLTARFMDTDLKTLLLETDAVSHDWFALAEPAALSDRLESLIFRLINRLPVDVSVSSVQGPFLTLSGGTEQGIRIGDQVDLVRASVVGLHPANGTWLEFKKQALGNATVIETKTYTAVARINRQTHDSAISVGDGAKIGAIAARVKFARLAAREGFKDSGEQGSIILPPVYPYGAPRTKSTPPPPPSPPLNTTPQATAQAAPVAVAAPGLDPEESEATTSPSQPRTPPATAVVEAPVAAANEARENGPESDPANLWDNVSSEVVSHRLLDEINAYAGPYVWSFGGAGLPADSGEFPFWLVNSIGGGVTRTLMFKIKTAFGGGLVFGNAKFGKYYGYDGYARLYWEDNFLALDGLLRGWRAGLAGRITGLGIDKGHYGGGDWARGGGMGGLYGRISLPEQNLRLDWYGDFTLMPLDIGRIGYDDSRNLVESAFGYQISLSAYETQPVGTIQWGGGLDYFSESATVGTGRRPQIHEYSLKVLAKYAL